MAQLGARFHGMEEVKGSNPFRSTKIFQALTAPRPSITPSLESKTSFSHGQALAPCEFPFPPLRRCIMIELVEEIENEDAHRSANID